MPLINWQNRIKLDNQLALTSFTDAPKYDYITYDRAGGNFPDASTYPEILRQHQTYKVMYEKYHNSYLLGKGSVNFIMKWNADVDEDMNYYLNNLNTVDHAFPNAIINKSVNLEARTLLLNIDNTRYIKNQWYDCNQYWGVFGSPNGSVLIETAEDNTSMLCILHNPRFKWTFKNVVLEENKSIEFTKTNLENDHYIFCTNNPVQVASAKMLNINNGYKIASDSLVISATQGEASVAIIEKTLHVAA